MVHRAEPDIIVVMKKIDTPLSESTSQNMKVLLEENAALKRRVEWFERQIFGQKS